MNDQVAGAVPQAEPAREVDRIRDIIFGSHMRDYEQRFQTAQQELNRLQAEIDRLNAQLAAQDSSQGQNLRSLDQKLEQAHAALRDELVHADDGLRAELQQAVQKLTFDKADRVALGELFARLASELRSDGGGAEPPKGTKAHAR